MMTDGWFSIPQSIKYILYFDNKKLYFFELSKVHKKIKQGYFVNFEDLKIKKLRKGLFSYKITLEFKDGSIDTLQMMKKVSKLFLQKQYTESLFNKFSELKNKN